VKVYEVGLVTTPMLYFAASAKKSPMSIMCTASHLGEGYTGIKPNKGGIPLEEREIIAIRNKYKELSESKMPAVELSDSAVVSSTHLVIYDNYISELLNFVSKPLGKYSVVVDVGNGVNSLVVEKLLTSLGIKHTVINKEIRGTGLSHPSNPKIKRNREQLESKIKEEGSDIGLIWDGDCDRCCFIDNFGDMIPPEYIAICIARLLKETGNYSKITADVRASFAIEKECIRYGIDVIRIMAWHPPIKFEMERDPSIGFGFELSGHYVFKDFYKTDDGMLAALLFINALETLNINLKLDLHDFRNKYYILEEINYKTEISEEALQEILSKKYSDGQMILIDGISVDYPSWRFNVRASRTEPIIRLNISGTDRAIVERNLKDIEVIINGKRLDS
jgi:phosphomannomutase